MREQEKREICSACPWDPKADEIDPLVFEFDAVIALLDMNVQVSEDRFTDRTWRAFYEVMKERNRLTAAEAAENRKNNAQSHQ